MDRYRYFIFNQKSVLVLGVLQIACAGLCLVCGLMDAVFRKDTPLSTTRTPVWGGLVSWKSDEDVFFLLNKALNVKVNKRRRYVDGDKSGEDICNEQRSCRSLLGPRQEFTIISYSKRQAVGWQPGTLCGLTTDQKSKIQCQLVCKQQPGT